MSQMFEGVRVVELAQWVFVPACGVALADFGAEVIKIEHPGTGDPYRGLVTRGIGALANGVNYNVEQNNRGKKSVAIDIKSEEGRNLIYRLVADADVFLTNFRPDALTRLGFGVADLRAHNPSLIYARGHGYGTRGTEVDTPSYDITAFWARGGLAHTLTPADYDAPIGSRGAFGDKTSAMNLAFGVAAALYRRAQTDEPSVIDVSLLGSAVWVISSDLLSATIRQAPNDPATTPNSRLAGYQTSDDRVIIVNFLNDAHWPIFCRAIGRGDLLEDPRFSLREDRLEHNDAYEAEVRATMASRTLAEWSDILATSGAPWAPVQTADEVIHDPQVVANNYFLQIDTDDGATFPVAGVPVEVDEQPATPTRAPAVGEHTEEVLLDLGLSWEEILDWKIRGVLL